MSLGQFFFKNRSYTPIPFLIPLFLYGRPTAESLIVGFIIAMFGEAIRFWGVSYAGGETRTTKVGASTLVTQGPYAYIRNPLYLGNIFLYFGVSIMAKSLFPYLQIIGLIYFSVQYYFIIKEEEIFLIEKFKDKYEDYYNNVRSIIFSFKPYDKSKQSGIKPNTKEAYTSEKRTFQSISISMIMILLIYALVNQ
jgi:hypothetical protein